MRGLRIGNIGYLGCIAQNSGFSPPASANLKFWGDATSLALTDGTAVASFTDKSGNANHATATSTAKPLLKTSIVNGKDVLRFDGVDDFMTWPDLMNAQTSGDIFIVLKSSADPCASANNTALWSFGKTGGGPGETAHPFTTPGGIQEHFGSDTVTSLRVTNPSTAAAFHIYNVNVDTNRLVCYWNGTLFNGWDKLTTGFLAAPLLGRNNGNTKFWIGDIAEILVYNAVLSAANRKTINDYLSTRYSITCADVTTPAVLSDYSGLRAWWKADSLSLNDGDSISSWADSSGNGRTLTQSLTLRPTYKTNIFNSLPAARFDGSNDRLTLATPEVLTDFTCIMVGTVTADGCVFAHETLNMQMRAKRAGVNDMSFFPGTSEKQSGTAAWQYAVNNLKMFVWRRTGGTISFFQNAVEKGTDGVTVSANFTLGTLGGGAGPGIYITGDIGEACYYNTALTDAQIIKLYYDYFRDRWGLP